MNACLCMNNKRNHLIPLPKWSNLPKTLSEEIKYTRVKFKWHKWTFLKLKWILLSCSPRCSSPIPPNSSSLWLKIPIYHMTNKCWKTERLKWEGEVGCLGTWGTRETRGTKQQWVPSISFLPLIYPGQGVAEVSNPWPPTGADQKALRKSCFP